jgi:hypothetical protein
MLAHAWQCLLYRSVIQNFNTTHKLALATRANQASERTNSQVFRVMRRNVPSPSGVRFDPDQAERVASSPLNFELDITVDQHVGLGSDCNRLAPQS